MSPASARKRFLAAVGGGALWLIALSVVVVDSLGIWVPAPSLRVGLVAAEVVAVTVGLLLCVLLVSFLMDKIIEESGAFGDYGAGIGIAAAGIAGGSSGWIVVDRSLGHLSVVLGATAGIGLLFCAHRCVRFVNALFDRGHRTPAKEDEGVPE